LFSTFLGNLGSFCSWCDCL